MRIFNKLVFSKKEPSNKNDIWFDGKDWKVFIDGEWKDTNKFKEDATTPDWNAQEGESGYIENKPFNDRYLSTKELFSNAVWDAEAQVYIINDIMLNYHLHFKYVDYHNSGKKLGYKFVTPLDGESFEVNIDGISLITVTINYINDHFGANITIWDPYEIGIEKITDNIWFVDGDEVVFGNEPLFTQLDAEYIKDTVLKTTPQSLSSTNKNQALANLGIDPVVWKYMMNPIEVYQGSKLPNDILSHIIDDEGHIKPVACKCFVYKEVDEDSGEAEYISATSVCGLWNIGSDGSITFNNVRYYFLADSKSFSKWDA